jgi:hypothetical protein
MQNTFHEAKIASAIMKNNIELVKIGGNLMT